MNLRLLILAAIAGGCSMAVAQEAPTMPRPATAPASKPAAPPFTDEIEKFEAKDAAQMPAAHGIVFYGSSTIRAWDTAAAFPDLPVINRGFGGSQMSDALRFAKRAVTKYQPKLVVLYEGDNDLNAGKSPAKIMGEVKQFAAMLRHDEPGAKLLLISVKPSPSRVKLKPQMEELNKLLRGYAESNAAWMSYLDIVPLMLDADGVPKPELYREDKLHMTPAGYALWNDAIRPVLAKLMND